MRKIEALYGKCNNPYGHGHDYMLEVSVRGPVDRVSGRRSISRPWTRLVRAQVLQPFDHRNLNAEVPAFARVVATTENLAVEIRSPVARQLARRVPVCMAEAGAGPNSGDEEEYL